MNQLELRERMLRKVLDDVKEFIFGIGLLSNSRIYYNPLNPNEIELKYENGIPEKVSRVLYINKEDDVFKIKRVDIFLFIENTFETSIPTYYDEEGLDSWKTKTENILINEGMEGLTKSSNCDKIDSLDFQKVTPEKVKSFNSYSNLTLYLKNKEQFLLSIINYLINYYGFTGNVERVDLIDNCFVQITSKCTFDSTNYFLLKRIKFSINDKEWLYIPMQVSLENENLLFYPFIHAYHNKISFAEIAEGAEDMQPNIKVVEFIQRVKNYLIKKDFKNLL